VIEEDNEQRVIETEHAKDGEAECEAFPWIPDKLPASASPTQIAQCP